ncbi:Major facilitator superfamily domain general substrate transporter [Penicillium brevicompactum]|uniref:Major facilitator superfamily domain general substrate transporter n=1 Tax=Penicillium brevicompactum TaxID=5074 RepID=UPI00253F69B3|nr:Major facilitator superfamily domain general substrate transporter [Penicillium brevicompactum]KAJ5333424.1 Major facilitator superfamily domain general substrate transporter [Penicillium brevicompactum]
MGIIRYAGVGFANILLVGTVYATSAFQAQLPRLLNVSTSAAFAPFGFACLGLAIGVVLCTSRLYRSKAYHVAAQGTLLYGAGVILAGYSLGHLCQTAMLVGFFLAGIGVGITYLAVVILLGALFPHQALARSAIGPLGFSSGAALCLWLGNYLDFQSLEASVLGSFLIAGGVFCLTVGVLTLTLTNRMGASHFEGPQPREPVPMQGFFSVLLFFNALPGMTLFSGLYPILLSHVDQDRMRYLRYGMVALGLGGVLSPTLNAMLGSRCTFVLLLVLRGLLIIATTQSHAACVLGGAFVATLFSHGAGFSIIPGLVKAKSKSPQAFARNYGRILVSWGVSGVAGCILNALLLSVPGGEVWLGIFIGSVMLSLGTAYFFVGTFSL